MKNLKAALIGGASILGLSTGAFAAQFDIPDGDLARALDAYSRQTGVQLIYAATDVRGVRTRGAKGDFSAGDALTHILTGTGFAMHRHSAGAIAIVHDDAPAPERRALAQVALAQAAPIHAASSVETVVVTSSKIKGDIQTVPIAITALSQEQLTSRQIAGGPDLVKEVPNLTFSKTNFTGYNIEIRGIGTQAISVTTDPAVAVAFNDTPFIRNHFFEQEFYDVAQVEVLRGPQGTLYGRNATAGVVNVVSAKPTDEFEAMLSADWGNYTNRRYEGMVNLPVVGEKLALRIAGEWTKRDGYSFNETTNQPIDGRDLWSVRATLGWRPVSSVEADLIWEHFQEDDDRLRSGKQLCKTDFGPGANNILDTGKLTAYDGTIVTVPSAGGGVFSLNQAYFSQGCVPDSLYAKASYEVPNGFSLPFVNGASFEGLLNDNIDPYAQTTQSTNLRDIQSAIEPRYRARNDTVELNASWNVTPSLTLYSDTGYNRDFLWSTEDYNRFDTAPGVFVYNNDFRHEMQPSGYYTCSVSKDYVNDPALCNGKGYPIPGGEFCDPQLGCSDRLVVQDLSTEQSWQFSQEFRLASNFSGPFNFSAGGNFLHYETDEYYYVFSNTFSMISLNNVGCNGVYDPGVTNNLYCLNNGRSYQSDIANINSIPTESPQYMDPHPLTQLDNEGHNYFLSQNPYVLNSYAGFGEAYYNVTPDLKLTAGLRWTDDEKHVIEIPSELLVIGYGYPSIGTVDQKWNQWTGRLVANWAPKLDFTDQSMFYASYAHGYKAGGANPPGAVLINADTSCGFTNAGCGAGQVNISFPVHPATFKPEFIDAYELGTKNTTLDGAVTLNGDVFFYNYTGYQISQIVDRTSVNLNFDATVRGAELEATYEPLPGLKLAFAGGYEDTSIKKNQYAIDLMDRTAGVPGWVVMKPSVGQSSNCIFPEYVAAALVEQYQGGGEGNIGVTACGMAYSAHIDPVTADYYDPNTTQFAHGTFSGYIYYPYPGYDPKSVDPSLTPTQLANVNDGLGLPPNNGEGFAKNVGGNELPNAPHFTTSFTADYTMPVSANWAATLHGDFYWQSQSFARVFNDRPYDKIRGYSNVNLALILTDASGWQVMGYVKNIFDTTAITGDFLNSDDSGLTTNVFLTDPRLYGVRITKHFDAGDVPGGHFDLFTDSGDTRPTLWLTLGGNYNALLNVKNEPYNPLALDNFPNGGNPTPPWADGLPSPAQLQKTPDAGFDWNASLAYQPENSDWVLKAGIRYGRTAHNNTTHKSQYAGTRTQWVIFPHFTFPCTFFDHYYPTFSNECRHGGVKEFVDSHDHSSERHAILDFEIGKNVGIGMFNEKGMGTVSAGIRVAQFNSHTVFHLGADPNYNLDHKYHEIYDFYSTENRSSHGIGPELSWDASNPILGDSGDGEIAIDWGVNAAMLFARQSVDLHHTVKHCIVHGGGTLAACDGGGIGGYGDPRIVEPPDNVSRSRRVTVPNLGGYVGLSVKYHDAKVSLGYRADEFFGAMDGGEYTAKKENRGFYGPYLNLSLGFGG
jgi:iron complex outermembrane recepter protein